MALEPVAVPSADVYISLSILSFLEMYYFMLFSYYYYLMCLFIFRCTTRIINAWWASNPLLLLLLLKLMERKVSNSNYHNSFNRSMYVCSMRIHTQLLGSAVWSEWLTTGVQNWELLSSLSFFSCFSFFLTYICIHRSYQGQGRRNLSVNPPSSQMAAMRIW